MPVGNPKPQTIASERYQKKAGYISKAFKLKREVAESFAEACEKAGVSQAGQITKMMKEFIRLFGHLSQRTGAFYMAADRKTGRKREFIGFGKA